MNPVSCRECTEPASSDSAKCRDCGYRFDTPDAWRAYRRRLPYSRTFTFKEASLLRLLGMGVTCAGIAAAYADQYVLAGSMVFCGLGAILADFLSTGR